MSENSPTTDPLILAYVEDVMLASRLEDVVRALGGQVQLISAPHFSVDDLLLPPALAVVDIGTRGHPGWQDVVRTVRRQLRGVPIVAFGPHVDTASREQAQKLGCDRVFTRGRFLRDLPRILQAYMQRPDTLEGCEETPNELVRQGIEEFNRGDYYACHETLETAWRAEPRPCRGLYQAILQLAVALHHAREGNAAGAQKVLLRALGKFRQLLPTCQGIDVDQLYTQGVHILWALRTSHPGRPMQLPSELIPKIKVP